MKIRESILMRALSWAGGVQASTVGSLRRSPARRCPSGTKRLGMPRIRSAYVLLSLAGGMYMATAAPLQEDRGSSTGGWAPTLTAASSGEVREGARDLDSQPAGLLRAEQFARIRGIIKQQGSAHVMVELRVPDLGKLQAASRAARDPGSALRADTRVRNVSVQIVSMTCSDVRHEDRKD